MKYTKEQFLKAAELGEVSMIDAKHIVSLLDEVVKLPKQQETLYTEEQVRKLVEEANYDGQYLHAKSVTSQMMRDNAESYSNEIIQSLKQPKKD